MNLNTGKRVVFGLMRWYIIPLALIIAMAEPGADFDQRIGRLVSWFYSFLGLDLSYLVSYPPVALSMLVLPGIEMVWVIPLLFFGKVWPFFVWLFVAVFTKAPNHKFFKTGGKTLLTGIIPFSLAIGLYLVICAIGYVKFDKPFYTGKFEGPVYASGKKIDGITASATVVESITIKGIAQFSIDVDFNDPFALSKEKPEAYRCYFEFKDHKRFVYQPPGKKEVGFIVRHVESVTPLNSACRDLRFLAESGSKATITDGNGLRYEVKRVHSAGYGMKYDKNFDAMYEKYKAGWFFPDSKQ